MYRRKLKTNRVNAAEFINTSKVIVRMSIVEDWLNILKINTSDKDYQYIYIVFYIQVSEQKCHTRLKFKTPVFFCCSERISAIFWDFLNQTSNIHSKQFILMPKIIWSILLYRFHNWVHFFFTYLLWLSVNQYFQNDVRSIVNCSYNIYFHVKFM